MQMTHRYYLLDTNNRPIRGTLLTILQKEEPRLVALTLSGTGTYQVPGTVLSPSMFNPQK